MRQPRYQRPLSSDQDLFRDHSQPPQGRYGLPHARACLGQERRSRASDCGLQQSHPLNPTYAPAYNGRALVFVSQGDYTRAVADVTKAGELASKKGQLVKAKAPLRAKPKIYGRAYAKANDKKGAEAKFNPFEDRASPQ